jgi:hypothetical protein
MEEQQSPTDDSPLSIAWRLRTGANQPAPALTTEEIMKHTPAVTYVDKKSGRVTPLAKEKLTEAYTAEMRLMPSVLARRPKTGSMEEFDPEHIDPFDPDVPRRPPTAMEKMTPEQKKNFRRFAHLSLYY